MFSVRSLWTRSVLFAKANPEVAQLLKLLKKEKTALTKLNQKHRQLNLKIKEAVAKRKAADAEKKLVKDALKPYRRLSAFNAFVKAQVSSSRTLAVVTKEWGTLGEAEKAEFQIQADLLNDAALKIFAPKPRLSNGFANFVKQNFHNDGRPLPDITRDIAKKWNMLTPDEKLAFGPTQREKEAHAHKLATWREERIKKFREFKST